MSKARKVLLIGMDGLMPEQIDRYKDDIPELKEFLDNGFFAPAYSSPYTCTATNWPTIATGAWVGTHGCTSFDVHLPGMELGETTPSFNSHLCQAEYFWHAAERQGKRSILINYPCAFPKLLGNGVVIGGDGLHSEAWTARGPDLLQSHPDRAIHDRLMPPNRIVLQDAGEWSHVPPGCTVLCEGVVQLDEQAKFTWDGAGIQVDESDNVEGDRSIERRYILVFRENGATKALLARSRNADERITVLGRGEWSGWVTERFDGRDCLRQYKLLELSDDGTRMAIYGTRAACREGWGYPEGIEERVIENAGGYVEALELEGCGLLRSGRFNQVCLEIMQLQADWVADCAEYLDGTEDWDSMWIQYHAPDGVSHAFLRDLESSDASVRSAADSILRETVRILFVMASRIAESCADKNTVVCIVSDHGNLPKTRCVDVNVLLHQKGWLKVDRFDESNGRPVFDAKRSTAIRGQGGVWINLRGREKHGCVEPGEPYEKLRSEIIAELLAMRDPETGRCPFALVGRREDLQGMGLWGDRIEDVVYFADTDTLSHWFRSRQEMYEEGQIFCSLDDAVEHGLIWDLCAVHWGLPEATAGYASNRPVFIFSGPGIRKGARGDRRVNLVDVAPTLAHVLGIRPPAQAEGRIVWEAMEDDRP
jgi:predicted AlkP superfamily phosphohydrolase/phosphomutase